MKHGVFTKISCQWPPLWNSKFRE